MIKHFSNIEDIYRLSDCYVFPTIDKKACIETPLSVLEAMACNLPIITTRFGSIPRLFNNINGLIFIDSLNPNQYIKSLVEGKAMIQTRDAVMKYSWNSIIEKLITYYISLL
jgi:glycosyltransferase involved in cell wall biosynthesis